MATAAEAAPAEKVLSPADDLGTAKAGRIEATEGLETEKRGSDAVSSSRKASSEKGDEADAEIKGTARDYFRIFQYASKLEWLLYGVGIVGAIIVGAALPLMSIIFGNATATFNQNAGGAGNPGAFQSNINSLVLYFIYLFVGRFVIGYISTLCICIAAARTTNAVRKAFLESLLRKEISHFDLHSNGSAASQVTTNGSRINAGIAEKLYTLLMGLSLFVSAFVVALAVQWKLALITMSIIPANVVIMGGAVSIFIPIETRVGQLYSRAGTVAQDALGSIKTIHAFGAQEKVVAWYDEYLQKAHKEGNKMSLLFGILFSSQTFLVMCMTSLAFWEGYRLYLSGDIASVGTVFTVVLSVTLGATSTLLILPQTQAIALAASAAAELFSIIDKPTTLDPLSSEGDQPATLNGQIEIRNLQFAYPSRPSAPVLQDLDLSIPAGKTTALVGPSGCGKSTTVGLLERWYQPTSGQILIDGVDISKYNTKWLRSNIRLIQQEPTLFQGTIFENVIKGFVGDQHNLAPEKQMELVIEACKAANAHDFIEQLPERYDTQLGERANMLSGGQRQRVSIARSIISDPKILLFDEATSALDPRAERIVQDALNRVSTNKTTLIIAHKLATVKAADNIAVMSNGKVFEQGTHTELIERNGLYAAMVRAQDLGADDQQEGGDEDEGDYNDESEKRPLALQRTQSEAAPSMVEKKLDQLTAGTLHYSLIRCVWIMLSENSDLWYWFALISIGSTIGGGTYPAQAVLLSKLIYSYTLTSSDATSQVNFYALMFFILALANLIGYFIIGIATNTVGQILTHRYRKEMIQRVVNFDQDFFDRRENASGALTAKLNSAPTDVQELMSQNIGLIFNVSINIVSSSILAIAIGWKLGLVLVFGGLTVIVGSGYIRIRLDQKLETATGEQWTTSAALASEAVSSIRTVSLLTLERPLVNEYSAILDGIEAKVIRNLTFTLLPYAFSQSADFLVMALGFWYGSTLIARGEYTTSQFFIVFIAIIFGGQGAAQFFQYTTSLTKAGGGANYILWLRTVKAEISETTENKGKGPPDHDAVIGVEDVEFRYKQRQSTRVLRGINIRIEPGQYAAFVGPSGCGKSTIVSLLERFYDPTTGRITLDDQDVTQYSPLTYRRYMSLVQQEPPLYIGSVRDNIAIGLDREPTEEEVMEACRQANAHEFVSSLPEGLNTPCGSRGLQFSGGQRQRIAVARALIRKPRLLLLDEATSALDTQSERIVQKALDEAAATRTTIAVAHRLSTIRHANVIFVIEDGKVAEMGTHEELMKLNGRYHGMCVAQSLDQA